MAELKIFIGYIGLIPQYHIIKTPYKALDITPSNSREIKPVSTKVSNLVKNHLIAHKFFKAKFYKASRVPQKRSTNYEGTGLNKRT